MAIQKNKTSKFGVVGNYWKIINVHVYRLENRLQCSIGLFVSEQAYNEGSKPLDVLEYCFEESDYDFLPEDNVLEKCYIKIKNSDLFFQDAVDVIGV